jgi:hypothetical protein
MVEPAPATMYYRGVRLSSASRTLLGIWGLWFTAVLSEMPGVHTCQVHDGHAQHSAMAGMAGHGAHGSKSSSGDDAHHPARCTCLGACCCAVTAVLHSASFEFAIDAVVVRPILVDCDAGAPAIKRAHSLPFANGPPAL